MTGLTEGGGEWVECPEGEATRLFVEIGADDDAGNLRERLRGVVRVALETTLGEKFKWSLGPQGLTVSDNPCHRARIANSPEEVTGMLPWDLTVVFQKQAAGAAAVVKP